MGLADILDTWRAAPDKVEPVADPALEARKRLLLPRADLGQTRDIRWARTHEELNEIEKQLSPAKVAAPVQSAITKVEPKAVTKPLAGVGSSLTILGLADQLHALCEDIVEGRRPNTTPAEMRRLVEAYRLERVGMSMMAEAQRARRNGG